MKYEFEVLWHRWHHNLGDSIFARQLGDKDDFNIPEGALFGDVPVYLQRIVRPLDNEDSTADFPIYVFMPVSVEWLPEDYFKIGQKVMLTFNEDNTD